MSFSDFYKFASAIVLSFACIVVFGQSRKQQEQLLIQKVERIPQMHAARQKDSVLSARYEISRFYAKHKEWQKYFWHRCCYYTEELLYDHVALIDSAAIAQLPDSVKQLCPNKTALYITAQNTAFEYLLYKKLSKAPIEQLRSNLKQAKLNLKNDTSAWIESMHMISRWYSLANRFDSAQFYLNQIDLSVARRHNSRLRPGNQYEHILKTKFVVFERQKDYEQAYRHRRLLITALLAKTDTTDALRQYHHTAGMLIEKAYDFEKLANLLPEYEALLQLKPDVENTAKYHQILGKYHFHQANYTLAAVHFHKAKEAAGRLKNKEVAALIARDLARTFDKLNLPDSALMAYRLFYDYTFSRTLDPERKEINKDINLTNFLIKAKRTEELARRQHDFLKKAQASNDIDEQLIGLYNVAQIKEALKDTIGLHAILSQMLILWNKSPKKAPWIANNAYLSMANLLAKWSSDQGNMPTSLQLTGYIDAQMKNIQQNDVYLGANQLLQYQKNQLTKAGIILRSGSGTMSAVAAWLKDKNWLDSVLYSNAVRLFNLRDQSIILQQQAELKQAALKLCYQMYTANGNDNEAKQAFINQISRGYGKLLNYQKEELALKRKAGIPDSILWQESTLRNRLNALEGEGSSDQFLAQLKALQDFYQQNTEVFKPTVAMPTNTYISSLRDLPQDEIWLFFYPDSKGLYSASVSANHTHIHFIADASWALSLNTFRKSILKLSPKIQKEGEQIYKLLLKPHLHSYEAGNLHVQRLKITAADMLSAFPFAALSFTNPTNGKLTYLAQRFNISMHYEYKTNTGQSHSDFKNTPYYLIAPFTDAQVSPQYFLPNSNAEVQIIQSELRKHNFNVSIHPGQFNHFRTLNNGKAQNINLHFATHAATLEHNPDSSYILFLNETQQPERLFAADIYGLNIQPALVFISACESGKGKYLSNEGLIGLSRGFFFLNAHTVVASLWRIADASVPHLCKVFYRNYAIRHDAALSLAAAQRSMITNDSFNHPFYWSAFIVFDNR
jgi:CHAT domain-containing protein